MKKNTVPKLLAIGLSCILSVGMLDGGRHHSQRLYGLSGKYQ